MNSLEGKRYILGGGMTGLAAGISSGLPVLEAAAHPGGICSSYYVRPGTKERLAVAPADGGAYRFEIGGGHWIFGGDPVVLQFIKNLVPVKDYGRRSAVYFAESDRYVPYPLQNNLHYLESETILQALQELVKPEGNITTMKDWLVKSFGPTLCERFFYPFHDLYTAGLYDRIAPQDSYKSPVNLMQVIQGAFEHSQNGQAAGYNVTFVYPQNGLNDLAQRMAQMCDVHYGRRVAEIDVHNRRLFFDNGRSVAYQTLLSTLPLNRMMEMTGLTAEAEPDPFTSVLVLNIGAVRGPKCPDDHWLYNPDTQAGFHRVGFYSNVDEAFLPNQGNSGKDRVSIYVERAFVGGTVPTAEEIESYAAAVVEELQSWGFIEEAEVVDPTWIDVAYTWSWPGSTWKKEALCRLEEMGIYQVGRYGRWIFQGIADSIRDGFFAGASFKELERLKVRDRAEPRLTNGAAPVQPQFTGVPTD